MSDHATLGIILAIFGAWGLVFFGVLVVPEIPLNYRISVCIVDSIFWLVFALLYFRVRYMPKIKQSFAKNRAYVEYRISKPYRKRLLMEIGLELEKEVTIKNIALAPQEKEEGLQLLTKCVCKDIINGKRAYETYGVYPAHEQNFFKICGIAFEISQGSAEIIAKKMTDLYQSPKYRKRLYRYRSLFI